MRGVWCELVVCVGGVRGVWCELVVCVGGVRELVVCVACVLVVCGGVRGVHWWCELVVCVGGGVWCELLVVCGVHWCTSKISSSVSAVAKSHFQPKRFLTGPPEEWKGVVCVCVRASDYRSNDRLVTSSGGMSTQF